MYKLTLEEMQAEPFTYKLTIDSGGAWLEVFTPVLPFADSGNEVSLFGMIFKVMNIRPAYGGGWWTYAETEKK